MHPLTEPIVFCQIFHTVLCKHMQPCMACASLLHHMPLCMAYGNLWYMMQDVRHLYIFVLTRAREV